MTPPTRAVIRSGGRKQLRHLLDFPLGLPKRVQRLTVQDTVLPGSLPI